MRRNGSSSALACVTLLIAATVTSGSFARLTNSPQNELGQEGSSEVTAPPLALAPQSAQDAIGKQDHARPTENSSAIKEPSNEQPSLKKLSIESGQLFSEGDSNLTRLGKQVLTTYLSQLAPKDQLVLKLLPRSNVEAEFSYGKSLEHLVDERADKIVSFAKERLSTIEVDTSLFELSALNAETQAQKKEG